MDVAAEKAKSFEEVSAEDNMLRDFFRRGNLQDLSALKNFLLDQEVGEADVNLALSQFRGESSVSESEFVYSIASTHLVVTAKAGVTVYTKGEENEQSGNIEPPAKPTVQLANQDPEAEAAEGEVNVVQQDVLRVHNVFARVKELKSLIEPGVPSEWQVLAPEEWDSYLSSDIKGTTDKPYQFQVWVEASSIADRATKTGWVKVLETGVNPDLDELGKGVNSIGDTPNDKMFVHPCPVALFSPYYEICEKMDTVLTTGLNEKEVAMHVKAGQTVQVKNFYWAGQCEYGIPRWEIETSMAADGATDTTVSK